MASLVYERENCVGSCLGCSNSAMKLGIFTQFRDDKNNKTYLYSAYAFQCEALYNTSKKVWLKSKNPKIIYIYI